MLQCVDNGCFELHMVLDLRLGYHLVTEVSDMSIHT